MTPRRRDGSIPRGLLAGDGMCVLAASVAGLSPGPARVAAGSAGAAPPSAEERAAKREAKLRRELEAVGSRDMPPVDAGHRLVDDQRAEVARRRSPRMRTKPAERVDEADSVLARVRRDRSVRRKLNPRRLARAGRHRRTPSEQAVGRIALLTGYVADDDHACGNTLHRCRQSADGLDRAGRLPDRHPAADDEGHVGAQPRSASRRPAVPLPTLTLRGPGARNAARL